MRHLDSIVGWTNQQLHHPHDEVDGVRIFPPEHRCQRDDLRDTVCDIDGAPFERYASETISLAKRC